MTHPVLTASTERVADMGSLVSLLSPGHPLAFIRGNDGVIGLGEALRLTFSGPSRISDAAAAWRAISEASSTTDPVELPGTGLVAIGSFAFADDSAAESVLIVPRIVIGRRGGVSWVTIVSGDLPPAEPLGSPYSAVFKPGAMTPSSFRARVDEALARGLDKVVLARDLVATIPANADLRLPLGRLNSAYPETFTFAVDGLMGASPETLVQSSHGSVSARVLAGSSARGADALADELARTTIAQSPKDREEHDFALGSVLDALAPHTSALTSSDVFTLRLPNLWHLASDVTATLADGSSALDLVAALHPTAAVAGTPTAAAVDLIAELEPFDRGRYAGPVGWIDARGDGEWAVALRCALVEGETVTAYAGAGIVAGSDPALELAETELKFRPVVEAFS